MESKEKVPVYKVILIGSSGVGKTNIVSRLTKKGFNAQSKSTVGVEFAVRPLVLDDSRLVSTQIWDTAGQERYRSFGSIYYRGAVGAIIVYDVTSRDSFQSLEMWYKQVQSHTEEGTNVVITGNKVDVSHREVSTEEGEDYARSHNLSYFETSAANDTGIESMFNYLIQEIDNRMKLIPASPKSEAPVPASPTSTSKCCHA